MPSRAWSFAMRFSFSPVPAVESAERRARYGIADAEELPDCPSRCLCMAIDSQGGWHHEGLKARPCAARGRNSRKDIL